MQRSVQVCRGVEKLLGSGILFHTAPVIQPWHDLDREICTTYFFWNESQTYKAPNYIIEYDTQSLVTILNTYSVPMLNIDHYTLAIDLFESFTKI